MKRAFSNKLPLLVVVFCLVLRPAIAEAGGGKSNRQDVGINLENHNHLNGRPFKALSEAIRVNSEAITQIQIDVADIQGGLAEMAADFADLKKRVSANEGVISALETKAGELSGTMSGALNRLAGLQSDLEDLRYDVAANESGIEFLEAEIVHVRGGIEENLAEFEILMNHWRNELDVQRASLGAFMEGYAVYMEKNDKAVAQIQDEVAGAINDIACAEEVTGENLAAVLLLQGAVSKMNSDLISLNSSFISLTEQYYGHVHVYLDRYNNYSSTYRITFTP